MLHTRTHPTLDVAGCYACKVASVSLAGSESTRRIDATERRWAADHAAYRRLVRDGVAPRRLDGAARIEAKANTVIEATS